MSRIQSFPIIFAGTNFRKIVQNRRNVLPLTYTQESLYSGHVVILTTFFRNRRQLLQKVLPPRVNFKTAKKFEVPSSLLQKLKSQAVVKEYCQVLMKDSCKGSFIWYMRKIFRKTNISYPVKFVCVSGGQKYQFLGNFCVRTKWMTPKVTLLFDFPNDWKLGKIGNTNGGLTSDIN